MTFTRRFQRTMLIALISTSIAFFLGPPSASASGPHDVRPGMTIEEATRVAIQCIQAASRMNTKDIRLQDTLDFAGINNEMRLDTLRHYIVRNPNIGVGSVSRKLNGHELRYLILNESLLELDTSASVATLAQTIVKKAGLARLTYARVGQIVANCRGPAKNLDTNKKVREDLGPEPTDFINCLLAKPRKVADERDTIPPAKGIPSAGVTDPTGKAFQYSISEILVTKGITKCGWSYRDLIRNIADEAHPVGLDVMYGGNEEANTQQSTGEPRELPTPCLA